MRALIIDDDTIRVPVLSRAAQDIIGKCDVEHSVTFVSDWEGYDLVMLDHDLGAGGDVSRHVIDAFPEGFESIPPTVVIHSMNPVGARQIKAILGRGIILPYSLLLSRYSS